MSRRLPIPAFLCATAMLSLARAAVADPALVVKPMAEKRLKQLPEAQVLREAS